MKGTIPATGKITIFLLLSGIACVWLSDAALAASEDWEYLFDGKTIDGWVQRNGQAKYTVEDGMIVGTTVLNTPNSFLCTEKMYTDFILELEFLVEPGMNSGIQIRSHSFERYRNYRVHGYQVEIDTSSRAWSGGIYDEARRGWLYPLKDKPEAQKAFKQNQWNHYRIEALGDRIRTWVNGVPAADLKDDMTSIGFIALQVHGSKVAGKNIKWRNIRIQDLSKGSKRILKALIVDGQNNHNWKGTTPVLKSLLEESGLFAAYSKESPKISDKFIFPELPDDWRAPFVKPPAKPYYLNGVVYDPSIDADCVNIYNHGPGDHETNQQPSAAVASDGTIVITWTQASRESAKDQSVVSSTSYDGGRTWLEPVDIERAIGRRPGSWSMIFCVPHTGRFYAFYWYDENQNAKRDAGRIYFRYSDDNGASWSDRYPTPMPRHDLDVKGEDSHGWNTGFPILMPDGAMLMGFSKMAPDLGTVAAKRVGGKAGAQFWRCEVFFLRAENILSQNDPNKLRFTVTPEGPDGLWVPDEEDPELRFCQEPFMALLPSGRVICTMRVMNGYPVYSISEDYGITWTRPRPFRNRPGGDLVRNVCGPCQISSTADGRIYFLFSNRNDYGRIPGHWAIRWSNRDPVNVVVGREMPLLTKGVPVEEDNAGIYFDKPRILLSGVSEKESTHHNISRQFPLRTAAYPQLLHWGGRHLVFFSNSKMDIRVKEIPDELLDSAGIPFFPR